MEDPSALIWGTLFGGIGIGYFIYGKKQKNPVSFFTGVSLFVIPYFIDDILFLVVAALALMVLRFVVKI
jgi:hypothetical protein